MFVLHNIQCKRRHEKLVLLSEFLCCVPRVWSNIHTAYEYRYYSIQITNTRGILRSLHLNIIGLVVVWFQRFVRSRVEEDNRTKGNNTNINAEDTTRVHKGARAHRIHNAVTVYLFYPILLFTHRSLRPQWT